jgi:hypothetical protein
LLLDTMSTVVSATLMLTISRSTLSLQVSVEQVRAQHSDYSPTSDQKYDDTNGCHSPDLHEYLIGPLIIPVEPHPLTGEKVPVTLGHEFSATVAEVGSDVSDIRPGDKVAVHPLLYDSTCGPCQRGRPNCCAKSASIGFHGEICPGMPELS